MSAVKTVLTLELAGGEASEFACLRAAWCAANKELRRRAGRVCRAAREGCCLHIEPSAARDMDVVKLKKVAYQASSGAYTRDGRSASHTGVEE